MSSKQVSGRVGLAILVFLGTISQALVLCGNYKNTSVLNHLQRPILAQSSPASSDLQSPAEASKATLRLNDTTRSAPFSTTLKQMFEQQFPETAVQVEAGASGLVAVLEGNADLAALNRFLTAEEKAQGWTQVPIAREKVAIVVGVDNPFQQSLTIDQAIKIFQGEITDWSEVGGSPGKIRFIDRPDTSLTRKALQNYLVFQTQRFEPGRPVTKLAKDSTDLLAKEVGLDGLGYAPNSQLLEQDQLRSIQMYGTLPDDDRYPFSQPFVLVYKGEPSPQVQQFLEFATSNEGQQAIADAKTQPALSQQILADDSERAEESAEKESPASPAIAESETTLSETDTTALNPASTPNQTAGQENWLPIGVSALVLAGVVGSVLKGRGVGQKQPPPRPAPNYAERMHSRRSDFVEEAELEAKATYSEESTTAIGSAVAASEALQHTTQLQAPKTQLQNPDTQLQDPDTPLQGSQELDTQLQNPDTQLQDPKTQLQDSDPQFQELEESETDLKDPDTQLQESQETTQLQDAQGSDTQLQDPDTRL